MGVIRKGLIGGFRGQVMGLNGFGYNGQDFIRSRNSGQNLDKKLKKTPQRAIFSRISKAYEYYQYSILDFYARMNIENENVRELFMQSGLNGTTELVELTLENVRMKSQAFNFEIDYESRYNVVLNRLDLSFREYVSIRAFDSGFRVGFARYKNGVRVSGKDSTPLNNPTYGRTYNLGSVSGDVYMLIAVIRSNSLDLTYSSVLSCGYVVP